MTETGRDEVDGLAEDWEHQRDDLTAADLVPLHLMSRIARLARHLDRERRLAFRSSGLDAGEFDVLAELRRAGPDAHLSPGALQRATLVSSGTMTHRLDKLEAAGLIARAPDPGDGRGVLVRLLPLGRTTVDAALDALLAAERRLVHALGDEATGELIGGLRRLLSVYERSRPAGDDGAGGAGSDG
ncbi:MAG: transcriptional regulator, MarR family [Mycobacterium sp.]|nr:transcriptional regulator, MarR family [Mycobacterium sp.]MCW2743463.1 transcriptional regulator, MarR family [Mycobacterium sp.]